MAKKTTHNPVAKHAHRFNRCARHKDATQYCRNDKHKARQSDSSGSFFARAFLLARLVPAAMPSAARAVCR